MRRFKLGYFIGQSLKGLWRNGIMTLASVAVLLSCLVVMGSFASLLVNIEFNLGNLGTLNSIVAFVDLDYTDDQVTELYHTIEGFDNVETVTLISKEEALAEEKDKYPDLLETVLEGDNPYPDSFEITYANDSEDKGWKPSTLVWQLENLEGIYKVEYRADLAQTITNIKNAIVFIFACFLTILFVVSIFVIINTIRLALAARHEEISVMRYIGATNGFIMTPFVFEGIWMGLISGGLAYLLQWYLYEYVRGHISADIQMITVVEFDTLRLYFLVGFLAVGVLTGIIGSSVSLRRNLRA